TVKKPSLANFWAIAPPTPHCTPTGTMFASTLPPCSMLVMRPSACHFEVAPITTQTSLPFEFFIPLSPSRRHSKIIVPSRRRPGPIARSASNVLRLHPRQQALWHTLRWNDRGLDPTHVGTSEQGHARIHAAPRHRQAGVVRSASGT